MGTEGSSPPAPERISKRRRKLLTTRAALVALVMVLLAPPAIALAACDTHAHGPRWDSYWDGTPNCTIGYGYDTAANYITGIQRILKGLGFYGGSIDGLWGPLSEGAMKNYQASEGITQDGIVGPVTWGRLDDEIVFCTHTASYDYHRAPGTLESCVGSFRFGNTSALWYIKTLGGSWQVAFSTSGPS